MSLYWFYWWFTVYVVIIGKIIIKKVKKPQVFNIRIQLEFKMDFFQFK